MEATSFVVTVASCTFNRHEFLREAVEAIDGPQRGPAANFLFQACAKNLAIRLAARMARSGVPNLRAARFLRARSSACEPP